MRAHPYPVPPSRTWTAATVATYLALALAGGLVLYHVATNGAPVQGDVVLLLWGGLVLPSALACAWGVTRSRYRLEWLGCWGIFMGTSVYLVVTVMGTLAAGQEVIMSSAPTVLFFVYGLGRTLVRAITLSLIDLDARRRVTARTGEVPEVAAGE